MADPNGGGETPPGSSTGDLHGDGETPAASGRSSPRRNLDMNVLPSDWEEFYDIDEHRSVLVPSDVNTLPGQAGMMNLSQLHPSLIIADSPSRSSIPPGPMNALQVQTLRTIEYPIPSSTDEIIEMLSRADVSCINLWKNGFSINNGPLRLYDDPANMNFVKVIRMGKYEQLCEVRQHAENYPVTFCTNAGSSHNQEDALLEGDANSVSVKESMLFFLLEKKEWDSAESALSAILGGSMQWKVHPVLFLELRRRAFMDILDKQNYTAAAEYFEKYILEPFNEILLVDQIQVQFASHAYIRSRIGECEHCLNTRKRDTHDHDDNKLLTNFVFGYIQLHVPAKLGLKPGKGLWRFAKEIPRQNPSAIKKSYRCLSCSNKEYNNESIGKLLQHLLNCSPWMDSPFLSSLLDDILEAQAKKESEKKKPNSDSSEPATTSMNFHEMFLKDLGEAKAYDLVTRQFVPDIYRGVLDRILNNMASHMSAAISTSGQTATSNASSVLKTKGAIAKAKQRSCSKAKRSVSKTAGPSPFVTATSSSQSILTLPCASSSQVNLNISSSRSTLAMSALPAAFTSQVNPVTTRVSKTKGSDPSDSAASLSTLAPSPLAPSASVSLVSQTTKGSTSPARSAFSNGTEEPTGDSLNLTLGFP